MKPSLFLLSLNKQVPIEDMIGALCTLDMNARTSSTGVLSFFLLAMVFLQGWRIRRIRHGMRNAFELGKEKHRSGTAKKKCTKILEQPILKDDFLKCTFPAPFL